PSPEKITTASASRAASRASSVAWPRASVGRVTTSMLSPSAYSTSSTRRSFTFDENGLTIRTARGITVHRTGRLSDGEEPPHEEAVPRVAADGHVDRVGPAVGRDDAERDSLPVAHAHAAQRRAVAAECE